MSKYPKWFVETKEVEINEKEILKFIRKVKLFSTREIMEKFGISQRQALKVLWKLESSRKICNVGSGVWRIID
jgi:predicted HTH transcriptional regulator